MTFCIVKVGCLKNVSFLLCSPEYLLYVSKGSITWGFLKLMRLDGHVYSCSAHPHTCSPIDDNWVAVAACTRPLFPI